jgi:hypothetical protein
MFLKDKHSSLLGLLMCDQKFNMTIIIGYLTTLIKSVLLKHMSNLVKINLNVR